MNLLNPFLSGIPTCHGSGGLAGHYTFGARTGGSTLIYGSVYILMGVFLSRGFETLVHIFPLPVLGIILLFEATALIRLIADLAGDRFDLTVAVLVGLAAMALPYGFLVGLLGGTAMWYARRQGLLRP